MRHAKAFAGVMAYQMYRECAEGNINPEWKLNEPMNAKDFREVLGQQMCDYRSYHLKYPGDANFRTTTHRNQRQRGKKVDDSSHVGRVSYDDFFNTKFPQLRSVKERFCNDDLTDLRAHINSMTFVGHNPRLCVVCGKKRCHWFCNLCQKYMCFRSGTQQTSISCVIDYHNECMFGLCRDDHDLVGRTLKKWQYPTKQEKKSNSDHIENLRDRLNDANKNK